MSRISSLFGYNTSPLAFFHQSFSKNLILSALAFFLFLFIFSQDIFAAQIRVAWDPNTEPNLAGYKVYYGTSSGTYGAPIDAGNVTTYTLTGLTLGQVYFVSITAYNTSNIESGHSNEVSGAATDTIQTYTVTTSPSGRQVVVDGTSYTAPQTFSWAVGSSHTLSVSSPQSGTTGTQYAFSSWSDGGTQNHTITAPSASTTYTANFTTQYRLTTAASPSGGGTITPSGTNWYNSGQSVSVTATASSGYNFTAWSGDLSGSTNPTSLTMNGPKSVTAAFVAVAVGSLSVTPSTGLTSSGNQGGPFNPSSQIYTLQNTGGTSINWTATKGQSWVTLAATGTLAAGATTTVTASINSNANSLSTGSYSDTLTFTNSTNGIGNTSRSVSLTVNTATQTYTITTNPSGQQVVVDGTSYTAPQTFSWAVGSSHTLSVSSPQSGTTGTQYAFSSWSDGGTQNHTITGPSASTTYTANFTTQYSLTTAASPSGGGTVTPSGTNWYNSGQSASVSAAAGSGYNFTSWSGDLSGSTNPTSLTMNGPKNVTAQFTAISETISTPVIPSGPTSGNPETSYTYIASGASSNLGHSLEYQFDWKGDGTDLSLWGAANQQKVWTIAGTYNVRVRARCSTHTAVVSNWSSPLQTTIQGVYQLSCSDTGIQCLERADGGSDSNNLVNGKPKVDVEYVFQVTVQDAGGTPQYVKVFTTQRSNPSSSDFYAYDMACTGNYPTGASCTYRTMLGPAAVHKFYFQVKRSNGLEINYPSTGYITGPEIQLMNGNNLVGAPRNISNAQLNGQQAFSSPRVYRWDAEQNSYSKVSPSEPVKEGEGYSLYKKNKTLPELGVYADVPGLEYIYSLKPGLNLVSNPYSGNVRLSDLRIQKGTNAPVSWQEAVARGWIVDTLYYYNGQDWGDTYSYFTIETGGVLVPWLGYWVDLDAGDDLYYLVISRP